MTELFVSYASVDRARTMQIVDAVQAQGLSVWIDQAGIAGGTSYGTEIANALREAEAVLLIASDASLASKNVRQEIMLAWRYDKPIIPLILHPLVFPDDVAYWLEGAQWIEVLDREPAYWIPKLRQAMARHGLSIESGHPDFGQVLVEPLDVAGNLPAQLPPIVGRAREIEEVLALLGNGQLVTLTGTGGTGKTRLALEVARRTGPSMPGGAWFVDLAAVSSSQLILSAIVAALGVSSAPGQPAIEAISDSMDSGVMLLVLDNLEQIAGSAEPIGTLLTELPDVKILATSRAPIGLPIEWGYAVTQLALPNLSQLPTPAELKENPAVRLFIDRAAQAKPDFQFNDGNARAIAEICVRLDGLPLAIELAAARTRLLPPAAMLPRLGSRLNLLTRGPAGSARQQTLRDTIGWSYSLLDTTQQAVFRGFAVFNGGASIEAAEAILGADGLVVDRLEELVDHALLTIDGSGDDVPRLRMLETIREYGLEQLKAHAEETATREAHARFYVDWLNGLAPDRGSSLAGAEVRLVRNDLGNLRHALEWRKLEGPAPEWWRLVQLLFSYWRVGGPYAEAAAELRQVIEATGNDVPEARADALAALGWFSAADGDFAEAEAFFLQALRLYRSVGNAANAAEMSYQLAMAAEMTGDYATARQYQLERLAYHQEQKDGNRVARVEHDLGRIASFEGAYEQATELISTSLPIYRKLGDRKMIMVALYDLATVEMFAGSEREALSHIAESLALARALDDRFLVANATAAQARAQQLSGDTATAARTIEEAERLAEELGDANLLSLVRYMRGTNALGIGDLQAAEGFLLDDLTFALTHQDRWRIAEILERLATIGVATWRFEQAARLLGRADRELEETGGHIPPVNMGEHEATVAAARAELGDARFAELWEEGRGMDVRELVLG